MVRVLLCLVVAVVVMIPASARAQVNVWLQKGVSGVGVNTGITVGGNSTTLAAEAGYSYQGILELDVDIAWSHFNNSQTGATADAVPIGAAVQYHPLKQNKQTPVSLALQGEVVRTPLSSDALDAQGLSSSIWSFELAAGVYRFFPLASRVGVTPELSVGWVHSVATTSFNDTGEEASSASQDDLLVTLGGNFALLDDAGHIWGVTPALGFGTGSTTFSLLVNFVAPMP